MIRYVRQAERGGIDRDMARVIDLARGDYCWLFSADDVMKPGALELVLGALDSKDDLYLCTMTICDLHLNVIHDHPVSKAAPGELFDLQKVEERLRYFKLAETTTAFFSFMGSLIVRRERWNEQPLEEKYVGSLWAHVVRICRMMPRGMRIRYMGYPLLYKRSGNDSFMEKGLVHRYAMAIDGYHRIAAEVFGASSFEARRIRRVLANEFPPVVFFDMQDRSDTAERAEIDRLAFKTYRDMTLANLASLLQYRFYRQTRRAASRIKRFTRRLAGLEKAGS